jgi:Family of unknown function (DUF6510)
LDNGQGDLNRACMLDGNAVAGLLHEVFAVEMTASPTVCAHCGRRGAVGTLLAYTQAPGAVLRCPRCEQVVLRIVETPDALYVDARGTLYLRLQRYPA